MHPHNHLSTANTTLAGAAAQPALPGQPVLALVVVKDSSTDQVISWRTQELGTVAAYIDILQSFTPQSRKEPIK